MLADARPAAGDRRCTPWGWTARWARSTIRASGTAAQAELARLRATADRTLTTADALLAKDPTLAGLAAAGVTALHVEGSPATLDGLASRALLDRLVVFVTPTFGGSQTARTCHRPDRPPVAAHYAAVRYERLGDTLLVTGTLTDSPSTDSPSAADQG